jgi:tetraacyldisaccharide 4'-kinase
VNAGLEAVARRAWTPRTPAEHALRAALVPAALAYGAVIAMRNRLYDAGWLAAERVPAHVVSVGNLAVGGTGKTPTTLWLAERLMARGHRVGIVTRGYGKRRRGVVVVGETGVPLVAPDEGGDEAVMLARRFAGPVVSGERRAQAAAFACARFGIDTIVLDDGFQHRALARDADLVLATAAESAPFLLPAGPLREGPAALARARALLVVDAGAAPVPGAPPGLRVFRARLRPTALVRGAGTGGAGTWSEEPVGDLGGRQVTAVAGVARPERFLATLSALGAVVADLVRFPDHHAYTAADVDRIGAVADGRVVVTTEKDLVKLERLPGTGALKALRVCLEVDDGDALVALLAAPHPQVDLPRD